VIRRLAVLLVVLAGCGGSAAPEPVRVSVQAGGLAERAATGVPDGTGRVLTVAHVLDGARAVRVGGRPARVVSVDHRLDVASLAVDGLAGPRVALARGGDTVRVRLLRGTVSARVLRRVTARIDGVARPALELDAAVLPGDSGAPVLDGRGRLVGLVFARGASSAWAVVLGPG
jgi:S1-C subfamily serine protease